jgi:hypothetical protein
MRLLILLLALPLTLSAATNLLEPDEIPPLRPPRAELPPTFWEQHGVTVAAGIVVFLGLLTILIWYLRRPVPPVIVPPATLARRELETLRPQPENGAVLSRVSQIVRHYLAAAFGMGTGELTTSEFCGALAAQERIGPELAGAVGDFLRRCDDHKFKPASQAPAGPLGAISGALGLIDRAEARLQIQRSAAQATSTASNLPS